MRALTSGEISCTVSGWAGSSLVLSSSSQQAETESRNNKAVVPNKIFFIMSLFK